MVTVSSAFKSKKSLLWLHFIQDYSEASFQIIWGLIKLSKGRPIIHPGIGRTIPLNNEFSPALSGHRIYSDLLIGQTRDLYSK